MGRPGSHSTQLSPHTTQLGQTHPTQVPQHGDRPLGWSRGSQGSPVRASVGQGIGQATGPGRLAEDEVSPLGRGEPGPEAPCVRRAARNNPSDLASYPISSRPPDPGITQLYFPCSPAQDAEMGRVSASGGASLRPAPSVFLRGLETPKSCAGHPGIRSSPSPGFASFSLSGTLSPGGHRGARPLALAH